MTWHGGVDEVSPTMQRAIRGAVEFLEQYAGDTFPSDRSGPAFAALEARGFIVAAPAATRDRKWWRFTDKGRELAAKVEL